MRKRLRWLGLAVVAVAAGMSLWLGNRSGEVPARSQGTGSPASIATVSAARPASASPSAAGGLSIATNQTPTVRGTLPYVLTSVASFDKSLRLAVEATGAKTVSILGRNVVLVEADAASRARLAADRRFRKVKEFAPAAKVQPELAALIAGGAESVEVSIVSLAAADRQIVQTCLRAGGGEMLTGCINEGDTLRARLPASLVATLAARGDVRWMERFVRPQLTNGNAVQPEAMDVVSVWDMSRGLGLTGAGQKITTSDSGIDTGDTATMHLDLRNRVKGIYIVTDCDTYDGNGHGTHTAGSIVGDGTNCGGQYRGTAHGADLYAWFCGSEGGRRVYLPTKASDLFRPEGVEAYIHSASWGSDVFGQYTTECVDYDTYVWNNAEFLPVFSAGNAGEYGNGTIGSPGSAKNVLTVGATKNLPNATQTASFSSRGPCLDGRNKPDISAPGNPVHSTRSSKDGGGVANGYQDMSGTSMSCPLTAGSVVLVRQWLVEKKGFEDVAGKRPTAALMKAVITGGAKGALTPNNSQGWGRVELADTLAPTDGRDVKLIDRIPFAVGETFEYLVQTTNAAPLDVQLCWVDYPGSASGSQSTPRLVNDLDLTVEALDGESGVLLGNGGKTADTLNNMESVRIATATPGKYLITVNCSKIVHEYDEGGAAALYVRGAFDPTFEPSGLERVRIRRTPGVRYRTLDTALADVQDGDVVEVLADATLREAMTLTNSITICATNAVDLSASVVTAKGALKLDGDVRVLFTNIVFTGVSPVLTVGDGSTAAIGGAVGLDRIVLEGNGQVELAGALTDKYAYLVTPGEGHVRLGETFGRASVNLETARKYANLFVNTVETELVGEAVDDGKGGVSLRWVVGDIPESAAVARLEQDGVTTRFADLKVLMKYVTNDASVVILKNCAFDSVLKTGAHALTVRSENGAVVTPKDDVSRTANAFVVGDRGTLTISNVVFSGFSQFGEVDSFVKVETGGVFRMQNGAELRDIYNAGSCGAVYVAGEMSMTNGARIVGCTAEYGYGDVGGCGGGVYLAVGGTLNFCGAEITGCRADDHGGGVYVSRGAKLNLSGAARITGNVQGSETGATTADDAYVCWRAGDDNQPVSVTNILMGAKVGIRSSSNDEREEALGKEFATLSGEMSEEMAKGAFFNDRYNGYYDGLVGGVSDSGDKLVWVEKKVTPGSVPENEATMQVEIGGMTNYFAKLSIAFGSVAADETAVVTLLTNVLMDADIVVTGEVTLAGSGFMVYQGAPESNNRRENRYFTIGGTANALSLTNVLVTGHDASQKSYMAYGTLFKVNDGGSLTLENQAKVGYVVESDAKYSPWYKDIRSTPAISVEGGARLTMKSGSAVLQCQNEVDNENEIIGAGVVAAGVGTVFRMEGGTVSECRACHGSGIVVENGAVLMVSGDARIVNNVDYVGADDNLYANDGRRVVLADVFTGSIGYTLGAKIATTDTNVFGTVAADCPVDLRQLAPSATNFCKDADHEVTGRIVTNATEALLVWSSAVSAEGVFTDKDGNKYSLVGEKKPDPPEPPEEPVVTNFPSAIAFQSIERLSENQWRLVITNRVPWCRYWLIRADELTKDFVTTDACEQAAGDASAAWTNDVETTGGQFFWKAGATWGIVPKDK